MTRSSQPVDEQLSSLREENSRLRDLLDKALSASNRFATVVSFTDKGVLLSAGPKDIYEAFHPDNFKVYPGDLVKIFPQSGQIMELANSLKIGSIVKVLDIIGTSVEIEQSGENRLVLVANNLEINAGDRVVLDMTGSVIIEKIEAHGASTSYKEVPWDSIGGHEEIKQKIRDAVETPVHHADLFNYYGRPSSKGFLLYGPPGCGKTLLATAVATSIKDLYKVADNCDSAFIYIKGPEILNRFVGNSEERIRGLFATTRAHKQKYGYPSVLFIDEADSILNNRGSRTSSDIDATVVPMFLAEMDGLEESSALIILATNMPDSIDPAVTRDGRIDVKFRVGRPNFKDCENIARIYLKDIPLKDKESDIVEKLVTSLFDTKRTLYVIKTEEGDEYKFSYKDLVSGSMIANLVKQAATFAIHRDLVEKTKTGIKIQDMEKAINESYKGQKHLNHKSDLLHFAEEHKIKINGIAKIH